MDSAPVVETSNLAALWLGSGVGSCVWFALLLYNVVGLYGYLTYKGDDVASGLSKGAWALGFLSVLLGPCSPLGALVAIILSRIERSRIFQDKSTYASAIPCRHASVNGALTLFIWFVFTLGLVGTWAL